MFAAADSLVSESDEAPIGDAESDESNSLPNFGSSNSDESETDEETTSEPVSESASDSEFKLEKTEFREPFGAKLKRFLPFGSGS